MLDLTVMGKESGLWSSCVPSGHENQWRIRSSRIVQGNEVRGCGVVIRGRGSLYKRVFTGCWPRRARHSSLEWKRVWWKVHQVPVLGEVGEDGADEAGNARRGWGERSREATFCLTTRARRKAWSNVVLSKNSTSLSSFLNPGGWKIVQQPPAIRPASHIDRQRKFLAKKAAATRCPTIERDSVQG